MATITSSTLQEIAAAVADELQLDTPARVSISEVTIAVTYQVDHHQRDFIDEWYDEYVCQHGEIEVPFS